MWKEWRCDRKERRRIDSLTHLGMVPDSTVEVYCPEPSRTHLYCRSTTLFRERLKTLFHWSKARLGNKNSRTWSSSTTEVLVTLRHSSSSFSVRDQRIFWKATSNIWYTRCLIWVQFLCELTSQQQNEEEGRNLQYTEITVKHGHWDACNVYDSLSAERERITHGSNITIRTKPVCFYDCTPAHSLFYRIQNQTASLYISL